MKPLFSHGFSRLSNPFDRPVFPSFTFSPSFPLENQVSGKKTEFFVFLPFFGCGTADVTNRGDFGSKCRGEPSRHSNQARGKSMSNSNRNWPILVALAAIYEPAASCASNSRILASNAAALAFSCSARFRSSSARSRSFSARVVSRSARRANSICPKNRLPSAS